MQVQTHYMPSTHADANNVRVVPEGGVYADDGCG